MVKLFKHGSIDKGKMKVQLFCNFDLSKDDKEVLERIFTIKEVKEEGSFERLEISCDGNLCRCDTCVKEDQAEEDTDEVHDSYLSEDYYHYYSLNSKESIDLSNTLSYLSSYQSYLSKTNFDDVLIGKIEVSDDQIKCYMYHK